MSDTPSKPASGDSRFNLYLALAVMVAVPLFFVAWRRARNPVRLWAARVEQSHAREIDQALNRCFGTTRPDGIRRIAAEAQRGPLPAPFKDCHRGTIAELLVAPNAFVSSMQDTPLEVYRLRERERVALTRLSASLRILEHAVTSGGANPTEAQRQEIAHKLEDLAPDVDQERKAFDDMLTIARDQAGWF